MKTKKAIASLVVIVLVIAIVLSVGVLAHQSYYFDYKIKGSNVNLRTAPKLYGGSNVLGLVQNGELINVYSWHQEIDNSYSWGMDLWPQELMLVKSVMWRSRILHPIIENSSGGVPTRDYNVA